MLETLRQPIAIAAIVSVGVHGLLWATLPHWLSVQEREPDTKHTVRLVELSPAEQSQLPAAGTSLAPQPAPAPTSSPLAKSTVKLPDPKLYNNPSLYDFPIIQPPPPITFPPLGSSLIDNPKPKPEPKPSPSPSASAKPATPPTPPAGTASTSGKAPATTGASPAAPSRPTTLSSAQIAALQQEGAKSNQLRELYAFNGPGTRDAAFEVGEANLRLFQALVAKVTGGFDDDTHFYKEPEKVTNVFPKEACPYVRELRNASFGAIVKPDGTLAEAPRVLLPSGYKGLDLAAIDAITNSLKTKKIGNNGKFQLIRFDFIFDPKSACATPTKPA